MCRINATQTTQNYLDLCGEWTNRWNISINGNKSQQCNFSLRSKILHTVKFQDTVIPQSAQAQYLGLILDKRLSWKQHITKITATCRVELRKLNWMLKGTSELSPSNKLLLYRSIVDPSFTYCIQIWGTATDSNAMRVQRVQNRALRTITDAPRYVRNEVLACDLHIPTVREQINMHSSRYNDRLLAHTNHLAASLANATTTRRRLKRRHPAVS